MPLRRPRLVALEVTTRCNLKCVMCPHGVGGVADPKDAAADLVEALWPALASAETVHLNGVGEPLMAEPFWAVVDRLKGRESPRIEFNTNGLLLTAKALDRLREAPLGAIHVSVDAAKAATYARIRGGSFARVRRGVRDLVGRLQDQASIKLNFVVMKENLAEMVAFVDLAAGLGVRGVWFAPLTETAISAETWVVTRPDGWVFSYKDQQIVGSDPRLIEALAAAKARGLELGVSVEGDNIGLWAA
ncbi:MAG TPA: radical SAM protein [Caulobacteraceae bacterium]|nr:radical SAM protein [Caulobacteraceae bacterium]